MKQADAYTLSNADLELVQGGYPADPHSNMPEDSRGKPVIQPKEPLPPPHPKPLPGQTPPIYIPPVVLA